MSDLRISRSIGLLNQKGGVGKTEVVKGLAAAMNKGMAERILIVDCDPNGDQCLDWGVETDNGLSLANALLGRGSPGIVSVRPGIDLIAGGSALAEMIDYIQNPHFQDEPGEELATIQTISHTALAQAVNPLVEQNGYSIVLIDTPPGERLIRRLVMAATEYGVLITKPDYASRAGFFGLVEDARQFGAGQFRILGAYIGPMAKNATRVKEMNRRRLLAEVGESVHVFDTSIIECRHAIQARELGITPPEYIDKTDFLEARDRMDEIDRPDFIFPAGSAARTAKAWEESYRSLAIEVHARYIELAIANTEMAGTHHG